MLYQQNHQVALGNTLTELELTTCENHLEALKNRFLGPNPALLNQNLQGRV